MNKYTVSIIGCGSIGALKPDKYDALGTINILTHAHAVYAHGQTELISVIDVDPIKAQKAAIKWDTHWLSSHKEIPNTDIIIIATPTETHFQILQEIIQFKPKLVICEKPFCSDSWEAKLIKNIYDKEKIPVIINYTRRFEPRHQIIKEMIKNSDDIHAKDELGEIYNCRILYERGFIRDGSHAIDLMNWWFGNFIKGYIYDYSINDYGSNDLTYSAYLRYEKCKHVFMSYVDGRKFSAFEIDIVSSKGRATFIEHGNKLNLYNVIPEKMYGDYNAIDYNPKTYDTFLNRALSKLLTNAINHLEKNEPIKCTMNDAIKVHEIYENIKYL